MLNKLPPRERQIIDLLYRDGELAVSELCERLPDPLSASAVRMMLKRLEDKGMVSRRTSDRGFLYAPTVAEDKASRTALGHIVRTFFNGSPANAASALFDLSERIDSAELDKLEQLIAQARKERGK